MGSAIGIDLGTTNSVVAFKKKETKILLNRENNELTPSVIGLYKGKIIKGNPAVDRAELAPEDTITSIKRLMGRGYSDDTVEKMKKQMLYEIVEASDATGGDVRVILDGKEYSPIEISAMILEKLKEDANMRLNPDVDVTGAVITVPAYFSESQKDATRKAGWKAGLKVKKVLDEPTAAAIAYGVNEMDPSESKIVLVYDLGGGTFDVSILMITGGAFMQMDVEGDMWLGGDDFDQKIIDYVLQMIKDEYGVDSRSNTRFMMVLKKEAEKAKKELSSMDSTDVFITDKLEDDEGNYIDVDVEITRERFEHMIKEKVLSTVDIIHMAIENANLTIDEIDNVILVGGSTTIPIVQRAVTDIFGKEKVLRNVDPMKCVSQGAAILAAVSEEFECPECKTVNPNDAKKCSKCGFGFTPVVIGGVTPMAIGILTHGEKFEVIVEKNTPYLKSTPPITREFFTAIADTRKLRIPVYSHDNVKNEMIRECIVWLPIPKGTPAETPVDVSFALDDDGILKTVIVKLKDGSGEMVEVKPDRGNTWISKMEEEINTLGETIEEKRKIGDPEKEAVEGFLQIEDKIAVAMSSGNEEPAKKLLDKLRETVENFGSSDDKPEWAMNKEYNCFLLESMINNYNWYIDADKINEISNLIEDTNKAIKDDDETKADKLLIKALDNAPWETWELVQGRQMSAAGEKYNHPKVKTLQKIIIDIDADLKSKNWESLASAINNDMKPLVKEIRDFLNEINDEPPEEIKHDGGLKTEQS